MSTSQLSYGQAPSSPARPPDAGQAAGAAAPETAVRTRLYRDGKLALTDFPVADISEHLDVEGSVIWLDLCGPRQADFDMIDEEFGLHKLAIEDALHASERPKLDRYASHLFLDAYAVDPHTATGELSVSEIAAFITPQALITVRKDERFDIAAVVERWDASPDLAEWGVGFLLHGLLDHLVDGHFAAVQSLDESIEQLEDLLFEEGRRHIQAVQRDSFQLRKNLVLLRRVVLPMREVLNTLVRRDLAIVQPAMAPYYQDVYDHVLRATEWTESLRDLVTTIVETNLTVQANRMNLIMKKVTSWAAIIAVPTAITGFYGQNLPYPGFATHAGLIASSALILGLSGLLYLTFKRKDWL
jgi:magnesium transporter